MRTPTDGENIATGPPTMMVSDGTSAGTEGNDGVEREFIRRVDARNADAVAELFAPRCEFISPLAVVTGPAAVGEHYRKRFAQVAFNRHHLIYVSAKKAKRTQLSSWYCMTILEELDGGHLLTTSRYEFVTAGRLVQRLTISDSHTYKLSPRALT